VNAAGVVFDYAGEYDTLAHRTNLCIFIDKMSYDDQIFQKWLKISEYIESVHPPPR